MSERITRNDQNESQATSLSVTSPRFPIELFPPWIGVLCNLIAAKVGTSANLVAVVMLAVISAAIVGRISIKVLDGYYVPGQIYACVVGAPGAAKGGIIGILSQKLLEHYNKKNAAISIENQIIQRQIDLCTADAEKSNNENDLRRILQQKSQIMLWPEYESFLTNITSESLTSCLAQQAGNGVILSPEPSLLEQISKGSTGRSSTITNHEVFLKGFGGEAINLKRISRAGETINSANLAILIGAQPDVINDFIKDEHLKNIGLLARFVFGYDEHDVLPRADVGDINDLIAEWNKLVITLSDINRPISGTNHITPIAINCDPDAEAFLQNIHNYYRINSTTSFADEAEFVNKADQHIAKLSLLCALMNDPNTRIMTIEDIMRGSDLFEYFVNTLRALEGISILSKNELAVLRGIQTIVDSGKNTFSEMAPYRKIKGQRVFSGPEGIENYRYALSRLVAHGKIRPVDNLNSRGGPDSQWYELV